MLSLLFLTAALLTLCVLVGQGILALCGSLHWRWWAPALGYAALLIVGGQVLRAPNHLRAMVVIVLVVAVGALALPRVRRAVLEAAPEASPLGLALILLAAIPFFATGRAGVLGATWSNDLSQHMTAAFYLRTGEGLRPAAAFGGDLITTGYPLGAHGLAALLTRATGLNEEQTFSAITLAIPALTGFAALGVAPAAGRAVRWAVASVVGLGYLPAAYLAQGSFKETTQALLVLASTVALGDLMREGPPHGLRRGVPLGLLVGGSVYTYSYGGAFWMIGTAGVLLVLTLARHPAALRSTVRRAVVPAVGALATAAIVLAPEIGRIEKFTKSVFGVEPLTQHGNLAHALDPLETIGIWFSGDFRVDPRPQWPSLVLGSVGVAVLILSLAWWWRRQKLALPAAVIASLAIWIELALTRNTYNAAKGLVVMAPTVMICIAVPLAAAWSSRGGTTRSRRGFVAARALGLVLLAAAAVSTLGQLRSAPVGLGPHEQELASIQPIVRGKRVLFLANDDFAQWELRGSHLYVTSKLYPPAYLEGHAVKYGGSPADVDNYDSNVLDQLDFIVTPAGAYRSEIPPNFRLAQRTPSYELYRRFGRTPAREPLESPGEPGTVFDCATKLGRQYLKQYRWAGVLPRPVVSADWRGSIGLPGHTAQVRLALPRGRWDVSLQYVSFTGVVVRGPGVDKAIPPDYGTLAAYWPAGAITSDATPFTLTITSEKRPWFGRLLGTPRASNSPGGRALWHVAFTRHNARPRRVPVVQACGHYVDWFAPADSAMH